MSAKMPSRPPLASARDDLPGKLPYDEESLEPVTEIRMSQLLGRRVLGSSDEEVGVLEGYLLDRRTGEPAWAVVSLELSTRDLALVPFHAVHLIYDGDVKVSHTRSEVEGSPQVDLGHAVPPERIRALTEHYGTPRHVATTEEVEVPAQQGVDPPDAVERSDPDGFRTIRPGISLPAQRRSPLGEVVEEKRLDPTKDVPLVLDEPSYGEV